MADSGGDTPTQEPQEQLGNDVPTSGSIVPDRFSSDEVFQRIVADADHEITLGTRELFFSALAGGFAIIITFLLYPLGFLYIIIGGYQLYTEITLPQVALTLERLASIPALFRHWSIVAAGNFAGGAIVLAYGGVLEPAAAEVAADLARHGVYDTTRWQLFFKGAFAGLIVACVVWVDFASRDTISRRDTLAAVLVSLPPSACRNACRGCRG